MEELYVYIVNLLLIFLNLLIGSTIEQNTMVEIKIERDRFPPFPPSASLSIFILYI